MQLDKPPQYKCRAKDLIIKRADFLTRHKGKETNYRGNTNISSMD